MIVNTVKKKRAVASIVSFFAMFAMMCLFCFSGCAKTYKGAGEFSQNEIVMAVGETLDAKGLIESNFNLTFESGNEQILQLNEAGTFTAKQSGQTTVVAKHEENIIDVLSVQVKYKFEAPSNIKVTNDGVISWDDATIRDNQANQKTTYTLKLVRNGEESSFIIQDNYYQLSNHGTYEISIKANETESVLGSDFSSAIYYNFGLTQTPEQLSFAADQNYGSQSGTLFWQGDGNYYNVSINGVAKQVYGNATELDFSNFAEGETACIEIISNNSGNQSTTAKLNVQKISTPELTLQNDELSWGAEENASKYLLHYVNLSSVENEEGTFVLQNESSTLQGLTEGIYALSLQAVGNQGYANGNEKSFKIGGESQNIAKISNVEYSWEIIDNVLYVTFKTNSEYNKKFVVKQNDVTKEFEFGDEKNEDGYYYLTQSFSLNEGENIFKLQTYPTFQSGEIVINGVSASYAVKSDEIVLFSAYNIGQIENVRHSLVEGQSVITFDNVDYAEKEAYEIFVNGIKVENAVVNVGEEKTSITIGEISSDVYGNKGNIYEIKVTASRTPKENEISSVSQATKTLTRLENPNLQDKNGTAVTGQTYEWGNVEGAKYEYSLYVTGENFEIEGLEPIQTGTTEFNSLSELDANFYYLSVKSVPLNDDLYLPSEENVSDSFYVALEIEKPQLDFSYDASSGGTLKIKTVEFGFEYKIYLNESYIFSVYKLEDSGEELTYTFDQSYAFDSNSEQEIKVEVYASEQNGQQDIHLMSESNLLISKMTAPTSYNIIENSNTLEVVNNQENACLVLTKDGQEIARSQPGQNVSVDIASYGGNFLIKAYYEEYKSFEQASVYGNVYLSSDSLEISLYRSATPNDLYYSQGNIYFSHDSINELEKNYIVEVKAVSSNGTASETFVVSEATFDLEEKLEQICQENPLFASCYNQKADVYVKLYAQISQEIEGVYFLPSYYATLKYNPQETQLHIQRLDAVVLNYDDANKTIYWNGVQGDNVSYEVYYNRSQNPELIEATISSVLGQERYEFNISAYDFSQEGDYIFYVVVKSDNALESVSSGQIIVNKLSQISSLNIYDRNEKFYAGYSLQNVNIDNISNILVNGKEIGAVTEFELKWQTEAENDDWTVAEDGTVNIQVLGKSFEENGNKTYYISSDTSTFVLRPLQKGEYDPNINLQNDEIVWESFTESQGLTDWVLCSSADNLRYEIRVFDTQGKVYAIISNIQEEKLSLNNSNLLALLQGDYTFNLYTYISQFSITNEGRGYFGKVLLAEGAALCKLNAVTNLQASIDLSSVVIDDELQKKVVLTWLHEGQGSSAIKYEIFVNGEKVGETQQKTIELDQSLFVVGQNTVAVKAVSDTDIQSNETTIQISKFDTPNISVSDAGVLAIDAQEEPPASQGYIVELTAEDETTTIYTNETQLNLQNYINGRSGAYTIRVLPKATNKVSLPNEKAIASLTGNILAVPTVIQDEAGLLLQSVDEGVVYYVRCEEKGFDQRVDGNYFAFPDDWEGKTEPYEILIYTKKANNIDSWTGASAIQEIVLDRLSNATEITFTRADDYSDQTLTWSENSQAKGYQIKIYQNDELIFTSSLIASTTTTLSQIETEYGGNLPSGELVFEFRTLADFASTGKTNSQPLVFTVNKLSNTIKNVRSSTDLESLGWLTFDADANRAGTYIVVQNNMGEKQTFLLNGEENTLRIEDFVGKLNLSLRLLATSKQEGSDQQSSLQTVYLDADLSSATLTKLSDVVSITENFETGKLLISTANDGIASGIQFFVEYQGQKQEILTNKINDTSYDVLAANIAEKFELENGLFEFKLTVYRQGYLITDDFVWQFEFKNSANTVVSVKGDDERKDYLLITDGSTTHLPVTAIVLRDTNNNYYEINVSDKKGYWVTNEDGTNGHFVGGLEQGLVNQACYAIDVNEVLANFTSGTKLLQISYITNEDGDFVVNGYCGAITYKKLAAPTNVQIDLGNVSWEGGEDVGSAYYLYFENADGTTETKIYDTNTTYYLGEMINKEGKYYVAVQNVSNQLKTLASEKTYLGGDEKQEATKLASVSNLSISNGAMLLTYNGQGDLANDINKITSSSSAPNLASAVNTLLTKVYESPFRFSLSDLVNTEFNLKFENVNLGTVYYTTVKAGNLMTGFNQTLSGFSESDMMYNKSILQGIETILGYSSLNEETKAKLLAVYEVLTDTSLWSGVASAELLFDDMGGDLTGVYDKFPGERIQAGTYNVYIQQQGGQHDNTISSLYNKVLSNVVVESSPMTVLSSEDEYYYINFRPVDDKTEYTMVLKHDENGNEITQKIKISKQGQSWMRSDIGGESLTKQLKTTMINNAVFVQIPLNSSDGIKEELKDEDGNLIRANYKVSVFVNGDDITLNSKTEEVTVTFLNFEIDSLTIDKGEFYWNTYAVGNVRYNASVAYKHMQDANETVVVPSSSGTIQSFVPTKDGDYQYIEFYTPGGINGFSVLVGSEVYRLKNVTKLKMPSVSTDNGQLVYSDSNTYDEGKERKYLLSNNVSERINLVLTVTDQESSFTRTPGVNGLTSVAEEYDYRVTEASANTFYVSMGGDDVSGFNIQQMTDSSGENVFNHFILTAKELAEDEKILLQSSTANILAQMIKYSADASYETRGEKVSLKEGVQIVDGIVVWPEASQKVQAPYEILYEVRVETYYETSNGWTKDSTCSMTYYTENNYLSSDYFINSPNATQKYAVYVKANAYLPNEDGSISTIENKRYDIASLIQYEGSTSYVLQGELVFNFDGNAENLFERSESVNDFDIINGALSWSYEGSSNLATRFVLEYSITGHNSWTELKGSVVYENETNKYVFKIEKGQLSSTSQYNIRIQAVNYKETNQKVDVGGQLASNKYGVGGLSYRQISVLKDFTTADFTTTRNDNDAQTNVPYTIDFTNYYNNNSLISASNINLVVTYLKTGETRTITSANKKLTIIVATGENPPEESGDAIVVDSSEFTISVRAVAVNINSILSSENDVSIALSETLWYGADSISFDSDSQSFSWTYGAEYKYKTQVENENVALVYYYDEENLTFKVYGVDDGEAINQYEGENGLRIPILYEKEVMWIWGRDAVYSYDEENEFGVVTTIRNTYLQRYNEETQSFETTSTVVGANLNYRYGLDYFIVVKKLLDDETAQNYYLPLDKVKSENVSGQGKYYAVNSAVYTDSTLTTPRGIQGEEELIVAPGTVADNGYYKIENYNQFGGTKGYYIQKDNVLRYVTCADFNKENLVFKVTIQSKKVTVEGNTTTTVETTREYDNILLGDMTNGLYTTTFEPNLIGEIISFSVQVRRGENNLPSKPLTFDDSQQTLEFNLFDSGAGTQENPFIISNTTQFENLSYRYEKKYYHNYYYQKEKTTVKKQGATSPSTTVEGYVTDNEKYYSFKQSQDLVFSNIDGFVIDQTFVGNYDGNGNSIILNNFVSAKGLGFTVNGKIAQATEQMSEITFNKGAALFKEIAEESSVKNLSISMSTKFDETFKASLQNESVLIAGLAIKNSGEVSGVTVSSLNFSFATAISAGTYLGLTGVVAENVKTMSECSLNSIVNISQTNSQAGQNFLFGGVALFNNGSSASMTQCQNMKNISVSWKPTGANDNGIVQVGGIVLTNNFGEINRAFNNADVTVSLTQTGNTSTFVAGIVVGANEGNIYSSINTGNITGIYAGGIAYFISNTTIYKLVALGKVNNSFSNLLANRGTVKSGTVYTHVEAPASISVSYVLLSSGQTILDCQNSTWKIVINYTNANTYTVNFQQS